MSPVITTATDIHYTKLYLRPRKGIDKIATKTSDSIFIIWYVLAEIRARPVKFRKDPHTSRMAGVMN